MKQSIRRLGNYGKHWSFYGKGDKHKPLEKMFEQNFFGAANFVETFSLVNVILMFLSARSDVGLGTL